MHINYTAKGLVGETVQSSRAFPTPRIFGLPIAGAFVASFLMTKKPQV
ncbi:MAG: hypothetical protein ACI85H_000342 [Paracoccaceae bacterium]|jgi:hypothetical protein